MVWSREEALATVEQAEVAGIHAAESLDCF